MVAEALLLRRHALDLPAAPLLNRHIPKTCTTAAGARAATFPSRHHQCGIHSSVARTAKQFYGIQTPPQRTLHQCTSERTTWSLLPRSSCADSRAASTCAAQRWRRRTLLWCGGVCRAHAATRAFAAALKSDEVNACIAVTSSQITAPRQAAPAPVAVAVAESSLAPSPSALAVHLRITFVKVDGSYDAAANTNTRIMIQGRGSARR